MVFFAARKATADIEAHLSGMLDMSQDNAPDIEEHKKFLELTLHRIDLMTDDSNETEIEKCLNEIVHHWKTEYKNPKNLRLEFAMNDFIDWYKESKWTVEIITGDEHNCDPESIEV